MKPLRMQKNGNRYCLWPIRLGWAPRLTPGGKFFDRHGWQVGTEQVSWHETGEDCMLGYRKVFGQTFHIGALKIMCGPERRDYLGFPCSWYESRHRP